MSPRNKSYIKDVDALIESTPLSTVLSHYGRPLPETDGEFRMPCVFDDACHDSTYGQLVVSTNTPSKLIYAHCCGVRGNLLTLLHGLETGRPPAGDKLRGDEFKAAIRTLKQIANGETATEQPDSKLSSRKEETSVPTTEAIPVNTPLFRHQNENARKIADLLNDLVTDPADMPPAVAGYFRERDSWLTPDVCQKWGIGYLPKDGRSMFRSWVVNTHRDEAGEIITYSGRDPNFDIKWAKWLRDGRPEKGRPIKHKYVKGYHRGVELYGQQHARMQEPWFRESLDQHGLTVVEGITDTVRLDVAKIAAVGLCSNKATDEQVAKLTRFARKAADNRITLLPDRDQEGWNGFQPLAWKLLEAGVSVRLGWPDNELDGRQPESIRDNELASLFG